MDPDIKKYTEANREAWNEVMPLHQQAAAERLDQAFRQPGYVHLPEEEVERLRRLPLAGKDTAHLLCNNGIELLSLKNLGAGECTGFDISDLAIEEARRRAALTGIDCQYVRSDVYEIGEEHTASFDLVYLSAGALGWLPDLKRFFGEARRLLREQGTVFIHEIHPFAEMLPEDGALPEQVTREDIRLIDPYFTDSPYIDYGGLDYVGGQQYASDKAQYWFTHTLAEIFTALLENGFALVEIAESPRDISGGHRKIEKAQLGLPLSYFLTMKLASY
jgi:SAM-dependent methyltransferase